MTIEDFWNKAFIASLSRVDVYQAKIQADLATKICIDHWTKHQTTWVTRLESWKDLPISSHEASNPISKNSD